MESINVKKKFELFSEHWAPRIITECNDQLVKIAKVSGQFVWHEHKDEDELFYVIKGTLYIDLESECIELNQGEMIVIPKATRHRPYTKSGETWIMLIEPKSTKHTGDVQSDLTSNKQIYI